MSVDCFRTYNARTRKPLLWTRMSRHGHRSDFWRISSRTSTSCEIRASRLSPHDMPIRRRLDTLTKPEQPRAVPKLGESSGRKMANQSCYILWLTVLHPWSRVDEQIRCEVKLWNSPRGFSHSSPGRNRDSLFSDEYNCCFFSILGKLCVVEIKNITRGVIIELSTARIIQSYAAKKL